LYLIANAHRIAYRPGGQGHVLDLFALPRFSVPAGAGPCFHHRHQLVFSWVLVLHLVDGERANLKALARHGPAHLAYQHYRCLLRAEISEGRDIHFTPPDDPQTACVPPHRAGGRIGRPDEIVEAVVWLFFEAKWQGYLAQHG
jgi:hypothetical protein